VYPKGNITDHAEKRLSVDRTGLQANKTTRKKQVLVVKQFGDYIATVSVLPFLLKLAVWL
jgi:hypothetical protein